MKDEKLKNFYLDNLEEIEKLTNHFLSFKNTYIPEKVNILKSTINIDDFKYLSEVSIYEKKTLVYDFKFNEYSIAIDVFLGIKDISITIFGRDNASHNFLISDNFISLSKLDKNLKPKNNERLTYLQKDEITVEEIVTLLQPLLNNIENGFNQIEK